MNPRTVLKTLLMTSILFLAGCDDEGDSRMLEKARLEGREQAKGELEARLEAKDKMIERAREEGRAVAEQEILAQNAMITERSKAMEKDLSQRHRFYQALAGTFEGDLPAEGENFKVKITFTPTISPYEVDRVRMPEEISQDLNLLSFNVQVVEWNPDNKLSAVGCRVENVRPDLTEGTITISKEACASVYTLRMSDSSIPPTNSKGTAVPALERSRKTAAAVLGGKLKSVEEIKGEKRPTSNAQEYSFSIRKRD